MVGLNGLEEELARLSQAKQWGTASQEGPAVALSVRAQESDKPQLVVFATFPLTKETVNLALKESGWGRIVKVAHVEVLSQIPLTGTGKTNYRYLDEFPLGRVE